MDISPVNNNNLQFKALKRIKLLNMADYPPKTNINKLLKQFKEDTIFQKFCKKFDVDLFVDTTRTGNKNYPFKCDVKVKYRQPDNSSGFTGFLNRLLTPTDSLGHEYKSPVKTNKWDAEGDFVGREEYKYLTKQMEDVLKEYDSIYSYNKIVKAMVK